MESERSRPHLSLHHTPINFLFFSKFFQQIAPFSVIFLYFLFILMTSNPHSFNRLALLPKKPQKKQVTQLAVLGDCLSKEWVCPDGRILSVLCLQNWPVDLGAVAKQCSSLCRMASLVNEHIFNWEPSTCPDNENCSLKRRIKNGISI